MKKYQLVLVMFTLSVMFFSCKKDNSSPTTNDETFYKEKLTTMIHFEPKITQSTSSSSNLESKPLKFNSYEEAYEFFEDLLNKKFTDSIQAQVKDSSFNGDNLKATESGTLTITYSGRASSTVTLSGSTGGVLNVSYYAECNIIYPYTQVGNTKTYQIGNATAPSVMSLAAGYSGIGTIISQTQGQSFASGSGTLTGAMQGEIEIAGTGGSFFVNWTANFSFSQHQLPSAGSLFTYSLSANSFNSGGI